MPRNSVPRMPAIHRSVIPALRLRGSLKAGMPFEIASTPVTAVVPLEKAWSSRNSPKARVVSISSGGASASGCSVPVQWRKSATPTVRYIIATKKYVGSAKISPDSLTPAQVHEHHERDEQHASATRCS